MIITNFKNVKRYYPFSESIKTCVEYMKDNDLSKFENGIYEIGNGIKVNINLFDAKDTPAYEAHRNMIDIQVDLIGNEKCYVADIDKGVTVTPYNSEKDVEWFDVDKNSASFTEILMDETTLVILFPEDIHAPNLNDGCDKIKKAIFKIPVDIF